MKPENREKLRVDSYDNEIYSYYEQNTGAVDLKLNRESPEKKEFDFQEVVRLG